MANSFVLAETYKPLLDEIYKKESVTSVLDSTAIPIDNGNTVKIYKMDVQGLGNYSRSTGYVSGDVTGTWESIALTQDRGRCFQIDVMDDEETMGMAFGTLVSEFMRRQVAPEIDAYTLAKIAGTSGVGTTAADNLDITVGTSPVDKWIENAELALDEAEVPKDGRILFLSEKAYAGLRAQVGREVLNGEKDINSNIERFDDMQIVRVPQNRFYTGITLKNGTSSGQTAGGYAATTGAYATNFMIVHPSAVWKCMKHAPLRIFSPEVNQSANAYKVDYRLYHDCGLYDNKKTGIYVNHAATAIS